MYSWVEADVRYKKAQTAKEKQKWKAIREGIMLEERTEYLRTIKDLSGQIARLEIQTKELNVRLALRDQEIERLKVRQSRLQLSFGS